MMTVRNRLPSPLLALDSALATSTATRIGAMAFSALIKSVPGMAIKVSCGTKSPSSIPIIKPTNIFSTNEVRVQKEMMLRILIDDLFLSERWANLQIIAENLCTKVLDFHPPLKNKCESNKGRFYKLVSMEGRFSFLLGCLPDSRTVSFCFSFGHVARYAPS